MDDLQQTLLLQRAYAVAAKQLARIGKHPDHVEHGHIGYLMTVDSILEIVKSFDPTDWYKDQLCGEIPVTFEDLPLIDKWAVKEAVDDISTHSMSHTHFVAKCNKCGRLALRFGKNIIHLLHEKNNLKGVVQ